MTERTSSDADRTKFAAQLQKHQERALQLLNEARSEVDSPLIREILQRLRSEATADLNDCSAQVIQALEDAIRVVQFSLSEIHRELESAPGEGAPAEISNLPRRLVRFLAERKDTPGFTYEVRQDPVRGWIIRWKEYTERGTVRGSGQFYERPYAYLEE
jgi:hypothetical protein